MRCWSSPRGAPRKHRSSLRAERPHVPLTAEGSAHRVPSHRLYHSVGNSLDSTMPYLPLRNIADSPSNAAATEWLESLAHELADASTDRSALCQRTLTSLYYPEYAGNWETAVADAKLPPATRLALAAMDPRN